VITGTKTVRRREIQWEDPAILATASREADGLEPLQDMLTGRRLPAPIMSLMGMAFSEVSSGLVVMGLAPRECHYNMLGTVHGVIATLLDSVMGCAVHSTLPAGRGYTTIEIKVNYVRPLTVDTDSLRAEGRVLHAGRRIALRRPFATVRTASIPMPLTPPACCQRSAPFQSAREAVRRSPRIGDPQPVIGMVAVRPAWIELALWSFVPAPKMAPERVRDSRGR
jgi:uncharacterized protein (TIGR00369 family)